MFELGKKQAYDGENAPFRNVANSEASTTNDAGFSSITPINPSNRRKTVQANFYSSAGMEPVRNGPLGLLDSGRVDSLQKTTTGRSQKSSNTINSRKSRSIHSLRRSQQRSRASEMQTNDFYVVGNLDTINVNYKVDIKNQAVNTKLSLNYV